MRFLGNKHKDREATEIDYLGYARILVDTGNEARAKGLDDNAIKNEVRDKLLSFGLSSAQMIALARLVSHMGKDKLKEKLEIRTVPDAPLSRSP